MTRATSELTLLANDAETSALRELARDIEAAAAAIQIADVAQARAAVAFLGDVVARNKAIEARRVAFTKPLNDHIKSVNAFFRDAAAPFVAAEAIAKHKIIEWQAIERARIDAERARREEDAQRAAAVAASLAAQAAGGDVTPDAAIAAEQEARLAAIRARDVAAGATSMLHSAAGSVTTRRVWKFRVVDEAAVPREYCSPDDRKIRAAMAAGVPGIPGVEMYEDAIASVRGPR